MMDDDPCPCPDHPIGCYGHPHECGCPERKKQGGIAAAHIAGLKEALELLPPWIRRDHGNAISSRIIAIEGETNDPNA